MHIVFVAKYRRKTLAPELLNYLHEAFGEILLDWRCRLLNEMVPPSSLTASKGPILVEC